MPPGVLDSAGCTGGKWEKMLLPLGITELHVADSWGIMGTQAVAHAFVALCSMYTACFLKGFKKSWWCCWHRWDSRCHLRGWRGSTSNAFLGFLKARCRFTELVCNRNNLSCNCSLEKAYVMLYIIIYIYVIGTQLVESSRLLEPTHTAGEGHKRPWWRPPHATDENPSVIGNI